MKGIIEKNFKSEFMEFNYAMGKQYSVPKLNIVMDEGTPIILEGFHLFSKLNDARTYMDVLWDDETCDDWLDYIIVKCKIPIGSTYAIGIWEDLFLESITANSIIPLYPIAYDGSKILM